MQFTSMIDRFKNCDMCIARVWLRFCIVVRTMEPAKRNVINLISVPVTDRRIPFEEYPLLKCISFRFVVRLMKFMVFWFDKSVWAAHNKCVRLWLVVTSIYIQLNNTIHNHLFPIEWITCLFLVWLWHCVWYLPSRKWQRQRKRTANRLWTCSVSCCCVAPKSAFRCVRELRMNESDLNEWQMRSNSGYGWVHRFTMIFWHNVLVGSLLSSTKSDFNFNNLLLSSRVKQSVIEWQEWSE